MENKEYLIQFVKQYKNSKHLTYKKLRVCRQDVNFLSTGN